MNRTLVRSTPYVLVVIAFVVIGSANRCPPTTGTYNPQGGGTLETEERCCSEAAPAGYIKYNDKNQLGLPNCRADSIGVRNVCMYVRYDNQPSGRELEVCAGAGVPVGWQELAGSKKHDGAKCGGPTDPNALNVVTIKKQ